MKATWAKHGVIWSFHMNPSLSRTGMARSMVAVTWHHKVQFLVGEITEIWNQQFPSSYWICKHSLHLRLWKYKMQLLESTLANLWHVLQPMEFQPPTTRAASERTPWYDGWDAIYLGTIEQIWAIGRMTKPNLMTRCGEITHLNRNWLNSMIGNHENDGTIDLWTPN